MELCIHIRIVKSQPYSHLRMHIAHTHRQHMVRGMANGIQWRMYTATVFAASHYLLHAKFEFDAAALFYGNEHLAYSHIHMHRTVFVRF